MAPITVAFLDMAAPNAELLARGSECLSILWPLASPRISIETLLDCYGALLRALNNQYGCTTEQFLRLAEFILASYSSGVGSAGNKKKVCVIHYTPVCCPDLVIPSYTRLSLSSTSVRGWNASN